MTEEESMKYYVLNDDTGKMEEPKKVGFINVVRCKDCRYSPYQETYADNKLYVDTYGWCGVFKDDDFCSYGEKK